MEATTIRAIRESMALSQADLAERLGVHRQTVSQWERGVNRPPPYLLDLLRQMAQNPLV